MWCVMCHTAFDWQTGEIVTSGPLHNPHYVEWQRRNGTVPVAECGNNFEYILPYQVQRSLRCDEKKKSFLIEFLRCLYHIFDIELHDYRRNRRTNDYEKYLSLRIDYLEKRITKEECKYKLQQQEKKENKRMEVSLVFDMFYNTGRTILNDIFRKDGKYRTIVPDDELDTSIRQINDLVEYTNLSMSKISNKYKNKVPNIFVRDENREYKFVIRSI